MKEKKLETNHKQMRQQRKKNKRTRKRENVKI